MSNQNAIRLERPLLWTMAPSSQMPWNQFISLYRWACQWSEKIFLKTNLGEKWQQFFHIPTWMGAFQVNLENWVMEKFWSWCFFENQLHKIAVLGISTLIISAMMEVFVLRNNNIGESASIWWLLTKAIFYWMSQTSYFTGITIFHRFTERRNTNFEMRRKTNQNL